MEKFMKIKIVLEDVPVGFQFTSMISLLNFGVFYSFKNYSRNLFFAATAAEWLGNCRDPWVKCVWGALVIAQGKITTNWYQLFQHTPSSTILDMHTREGLSEGGREVKVKFVTRKWKWLMTGMTGSRDWFVKLKMTSSITFFSQVDSLWKVLRSQHVSYMRN